MPGQYAMEANGESAARRRSGDLADTLVRALGFEAAVRACRANSWDGILAQVHARHPRSRFPAARHNKSDARYPGLP